MIPMKVIAKRAGCSRSHVITFMKRLGVEHVGAMGNQYYYAIADAESVIAKISEEKGKKRAPVRSRMPAQKERADGGEVVDLLRRIAEGIDVLVAGRRQRPQPAKGNHTDVAAGEQKLIWSEAENKIVEYLDSKTLVLAGDVFAHVHPGHRHGGARWTHMNACLQGLGWRQRVEPKPGGGRHAVWYELGARQ
jgi:hypothetical protein